VKNSYNKAVLIWIVVGVVVFMLGIFALNALSPFLFRSIPSIRRELLRAAPLGTNVEDVMDVIASDSKWRNPRIIENTIRAHTYHLPPYLVVTWDFDANGALIDVHIRKHWSP
jgi:hypothetical protein